MQMKFDDILYDVVIEKKRTTKHTYIRVKEDLKIYVTTNIKADEEYLIEVLRQNYNSIAKMIQKQLHKAHEKEKFLYLGKSYEIIYTDNFGVSIGEKKVYINKSIDLDKWYKKEAKTIFQERLDFWYQHFSRKIQKPTLWIRKMSSRWGVCNTKDINITLNSELMKRDIKYLDYVIVHELSHLIYPNHSRKFWAVVEENYKEYKKVRKEMKNF